MNDAKNALRYYYVFFMLFLAVFFTGLSQFMDMSTIKNTTDVIFLIAKLLPVIVAFIVPTLTNRDMRGNYDKDLNKVAAIIFLVGAALSAYCTVATIVSFKNCALEAYIYPLSFTLCYATLAVTLLKNKRVLRIIFAVLSFACIITVIVLEYQGYVELYNNYALPIAYSLKSTGILLALIDVPMVFPNDDEERNNEFKLAKLRATVMVVFIVALFMFPKGSTDGTCSSCGKSFSEGSSDYSSIMRSNFCNRCHDNFSYTMDATDSW